MRWRLLDLSVRPLPIVHPPLADELLSSWLNRHASFYGVTGGRLLRHCSLEAASLRDLDLKLTPHDQHRLAHLFRYDPRAIRKRCADDTWHSMWDCAAVG
jgi:hypothetical protein